MPKKELGQFNTTKKDYILSGFEPYIKNKSWIDPYAGNGDLLEWAQLNGAESIEGYDVDSSKESHHIQIRDTLDNPPNFTGKYILANPPYLARNKSSNKTLYDKYNENDLYKISILTTNGCEGGIFIVPLNFLSSICANSIRDVFFKNYRIIHCKIFEETVFEDTDYTVCAFYFEKRNEVNRDSIQATFHPSQQQLLFDITKKHHWILGEDFYKYTEGISHKGIGRWTLKNGSDGYSFENRETKSEKSERGYIYVNDFKESQRLYFCNDALKDIILIRAIDTGTTDGRIGLSDIRQVANNKYPILLGLETSRNLAHVRFENSPSIEEQLLIIERVNKILETFREKYNSVFLTSFRNSTKFYSRKRASFDILYKMITRAITEIHNGT